MSLEQKVKMWDKLSEKEKNETRMDILITGLKYFEQLVWKNKKFLEGELSKDEFLAKLEHVGIELDKLVKFCYRETP